MAQRTKYEKKALKVPCPRCYIMEGKPCLDMRTPEGETRYLAHPHQERIVVARNTQ